MTRRLRDGNDVKIKITTASTHRMTTRRRRRAAETAAEQTRATAAAEPKTAAAIADSNAKKYRDRDAHEAFFRPNNAQPRKRKNRKKKKTKRVGWTDKQRTKWAHAHWIIHHGTAQEAKQFLQLKDNTNNVPEETIAALTLMTTNPFDVRNPATGRAIER